MVQLCYKVFYNAMLLPMHHLVQWQHMRMLLLHMADLKMETVDMPKDYLHSEPDKFRLHFDKVDDYVWLQAL